MAIFDPICAPKNEDEGGPRSSGAKERRTPLPSSKKTPPSRTIPHIVRHWIVHEFEQLLGGPHLGYPLGCVIVVICLLSLSYIYIYIIINTFLCLLL